jgi:2-methylaconitate cis-trans-isomerase PrpF
MWSVVCGNVSAGVGPFAIDEGLVDAKEPITKVRINCVGLKPPRTLVAEVPVIDGKAKVVGDYQIDGVPGTGAKIGLDWADLAGSTTGKLLPTGNVKDTLKVEGLGRIEVSIVDQSLPQAYCRAKDVGIKGTEGPKEFDSNERLLQTLYAIEAAGRKLINSQMCAVAVVAEPTEYASYTTGETIRAKDVDFLSRWLFMGKLHKAAPGGGTANCGIAAKIPGTIVNEMISEDAKKRLEVRIGHPAGIIMCESQVETSGAGMRVKRDLIFRTSRRIMDGYVYVRESIFHGV